MRMIFNIEKLTKRNFKSFRIHKTLGKDETIVDMLKRDLMYWATWSKFDISAALNKGLMDL